MTAKGSLIVVGTGIRFGSQITFEARAEIERADVVLTISIDPLMLRWLESINPNTVSFHGLYQPGKDRLVTYDEITESVVEHVRQGKRTCFAVYGHPGVLVYSSREAIRRAREEGYEAHMLPAVSAEDCLFADFGLDIATTGCQSYEVNDFLIHRRPFDVNGALILWQIALAGESLHSTSEANLRGLRVLSDYLLRSYPAGHFGFVYEAAQYPLAEPYIERVLLAGLPEARVTTRSTLFVPPAGRAEPDLEMVRALRGE